MDENLEILDRLWTEQNVNGEWWRTRFSAAVMYPKPVQQPRMPILIGGYVDRVLKRAATAGDGWLTYFYPPEDFTKSWTKIRSFAEGGRQGPGHADERRAAADHGRPVARGGARAR